MWQASLSSAGISDHYSEFQFVIRHYLPPTHSMALRAMIKYAALDWPELPSLDIDAYIRGLWPHTPHDPLPRRGLGVPYPVYYAMTGVFRDHTARSSIARRILGGLLSDVGTGATPTTYYEDVLAARETLTLVLDLLDPAHADTGWRASAHHALRAADGLGLSPGSRAYHHVERYRALLTGEREVGVPQVRQPEGVRRRRGSRQHEDTAYRERIQRQAAAIVAADADSRERALTSGEEVQSGALISAGGASYQHVHRSAPESMGEPCDAPGVDYVRRAQPSALTPRDDRMLVHQASRMAPTSALPAETDFHRLPLARIAAALESLSSDATAMAYVWLLATTGIPPSRLGATRLGGDIPSGDEPVWDADSGCLSYRLERGPVCVGTGEHLVVSLHLPQAIREALASSEDRPFDGAHKRVPGRLQTAARQHPGPTPTPSRLAASAIYRLAPHARDQAAIATLSGRYPLALAAPAAYRAYPTVELQQMYDAAAASLVREIKQRCNPSAAVRDWLDQAAAPSPNQPASRLIGSGRLPSTTQVRSLVGRLREACSDADREICQQAMRGPVHLHTLLRLVEAHAAYVYLAWQMATGARPVSANTVAVRVGLHDAYLADKASGRHVERRLIPLPSLLLRHLLAHSRLIAAAEQVLEHRQSPVSSDPGMQASAIPVYLHYRRRHGVQRVTMGQQRFAEWLEVVDPGCAWPANATRHYFASVMRRKVSEDAVMALLGHARHGLSLHALTSTATIRWDDVRDAQDRLLAHVECQPLTLSGVAHAR